MVERSTISITVDVDTAREFGALPQAKRELIGMILGRRLNELITGPTRSLEEIMDDIGREAEAKGMTPEILASILNDK